MPDALSQLPPIQAAKGGKGSMACWEAAKALPTPKKPHVSITEAKRVAKLLQGLGKTVTGITAAPNGGFTVTAADPATIPANEPNPWDKVLAK